MSSMYHNSVKPISRKSGRSACAAAAYRSGEVVHDQRTGLTHDYTHKSDVAFTQLVGWEGTREELWNAAEAAEKRVDACVAREYEIGIPAELNMQQAQALAQEYATWLHKEYGIAVDLCMHDKPGNRHAHLQTTTRTVNPQGNELVGKSWREWSPQDRKAAGHGPRHEDLERARAVYAQLANAALARAGSDTQLDHRSYKRQGLDKVPTRHLGAAATAMERRGERTEIGDYNRLVHEINATQAEIVSLQQAREARDAAAAAEAAQRLAAAEQVRQRWQNKSPAEVQQRLEQLTDPVKYVAADPAEQANRHAYTRAVQRRDNCQGWRNTCADDLQTLEKQHRLAVVAMAAGLRPAAATIIEAARATLAVAEAELVAAKQAVAQLAAKGKALVKALQQQYTDTPAERRAEHDILTEMLADPVYQANAERSTAQLVQRLEQRAEQRDELQNTLYERRGHGPDETRDEALRRQAAEQQQRQEREREAARERAKLEREARQVSGPRSSKSKGMGM